MGAGPATHTGGHETSGHRSIQEVSVFSHRLCLVLVAGAGVTLAGHRAVEAQTSNDTLRVGDAIAMALRESPEVRASRLLADVQRHGVLPAGALPSPMLGVGFMNRRLDLSAGEPMAMNQIQLSQTLPWSGKRVASTAREEQLLAAAEFDAADVSASVVERVRGLYFHMAWIDRAIGVMVETSALLSDLQETAAARYAVGSGVQQDVLQAQVARARMAVDIRGMEAERTAAQARFNALLGRRPDAPIPALDLPGPDPSVPGLEVLMAMAEARPALQAARSRIEAAEEAQEIADKAHLPDVSLTVGYSQRTDLADLLSIMVGVPLPLWRASAQDPLRRQAEAFEAVTQARELELYNETYARLAEHRSAALRALDVHELLRSDVLPQARAAVESGVSAYRVGALDFMAVLESRMTVNRYEIERLRLAAEYQSARAGIDALTGVIPGGDR
jgi:cobalt-zinc-cadmium efflux system outer membrane protein